MPAINYLTTVISLITIVSTLLTTGKVYQIILTSPNTTTTDISFDTNQQQLLSYYLAQQKFIVLSGASHVSAISPAVAKMVSVGLSIEA